MTARALLLIALLLGGAACGSSTTSPTSPSIVAPSSSEVFAGTLSVSGSGFYSFLFLADGTVAVTLASLTSAATGAPLSTPMKIGVGIPAGTGCSLLTSQVAASALTAQIAVPLTASTYCVSLTDTGGLTGDANFAVRITQGSLALTPGTSPETFASNLAKGGVSSRTFAVTAGGNVTVRLDSVTPSRVVGFGLGIYRTDNSTCSLYQSVTSGPGAQITATVDQGTYCVKVFDVGNLTDFVAFSASIIHP